MLSYTVATPIEVLDLDRTRRAARYYRAEHPYLYPTVASRIATRLRKAIGLSR